MSTRSTSALASTARTSNASNASNPRRSSRVHFKLSRNRKCQVPARENFDKVASRPYHTLTHQPARPFCPEALSLREAVERGASNANAARKAHDNATRMESEPAAKAVLLSMGWAQKFAPEWFKATSAEASAEDRREREARKKKKRERVAR